MKTISVHLYQFDELEDKAKEVAREWFRKGYPDYDWWDTVYDDAKDIAKFFGVEIKDIGFSGFWSQGDGACFTGTFRSADLIKTTEEHFKSEYPTEEWLHVLLRRLQTVKHQEEALLEITARGHYSHSGTMDVDDPDCYYVLAEALEIRSCLRSFADWIYAQLEKEYEYLCSDECVDETIRANEYWFLVDGSRFAHGDD